MAYIEKFDFKELCKKPKYKGANCLKRMGRGEGALTIF